MTLIQFKYLLNAYTHSPGNSMHHQENMAPAIEKKLN